MLIRHRSSLGGLGVPRDLAAAEARLERGQDSDGRRLRDRRRGLHDHDPLRVAYSIIGAVVLNLVLTFNHRPGRYMGM